MERIYLLQPLILIQMIRLHCFRLSRMMIWIIYLLPPPIPEDALPPFSDDDIDYIPTHPLVPEDDLFGQECNSSHDCSDFVTEMCVGGSCIQRECGAGVGSCGEDQFCNESRCIQLDCSEGQECADGYVCVNGTCDDMIDEDDDFDFPIDPLPTLSED